MKTIEVNSHFGTKTLTRDEFAKQWTDHARQLRNLSWGGDWQAKTQSIINDVQQEAEAEFDRVWAKQNPDNATAGRVIFGQ